MRSFLSVCGVCLVSLSLSACGSPAIIDASTTIASMRGCEPAELTVAVTDSGYQVIGCGPSAVYECADGTCTESAGGSDDAWAAEADAAFAGITSEVLSCNDGAPVTVQVHLDGEGQPQSMASELTGDARGCVGRLILDQAEFPAGGRERLVSHSFGTPTQTAEPQAPIDDAPAEPIPEPSMDEPTTDEPPAEDAEQSVGSGDPDSGDPDSGDPDVGE